MTISLTSLRVNCVFTALNCLPVFFITTSFKFCGSIGKSSNFHVLYFSSYTSGSAKVTKCPSAHVTIYFEPSIKPFPFLLQLSTLAISRPTEGFSANTTVLLMFKNPLFKKHLSPLYHRLHHIAVDSCLRFDVQDMRPPQFNY